MEHDPPSDPRSGKRLCIDPMSIPIKVVREQDMASHIGKDDFCLDLVDFTKIKAVEVPGDTLIDHFIKDTLVQEFGIKAPFQLRLFCTRYNETCRPGKALTSCDTVMPVTNLAVQSKGDVKLYLEQLNSDCRNNPTGSSALVFLKFYDPKERYLRYVGSLYVDLHSKPCDIVPKLKQLAGICQEKQILLYKEILTKPHVLCEQINTFITFGCSKFKDGDIICYQEIANKPGDYAFPYVPHFLQHMQDIQSLTREMHALQQENLALKVQFGRFSLEIENKKKECNQMNQILRLNSAFIVYLPESTLNDATNHFSSENLVGENEVGQIYKGVIDATEVAIKKSRNIDMFKHELAILRQCRKLPNVVKVLGSCSEAISYVYPWPSKGSLEDYTVGGSSGSSTLKWYDRTRILGEICSVLGFLHTCQPPLVHGDLRPSNVLLDDGFRVMVTNIGMIDEVLKSGSLPFAILPFMDPEFATSLEFTPSSDVYSLGILMMCLLTGKPAVKIAETLKDALQNDSFPLLLDGSAVHWPLMMARQLAVLAVRCADTSRSNRPTIMEISAEVEGFFLKAEEKGTPEHFLCPIKRVIMENPQVTCDGHTYEKESIEEWFNSPQNLNNPSPLSPLTGLPLTSKTLVTNYCIRSAIKDFQDKWRP